jgi:hypothetical protein
MLCTTLQASQPPSTQNNNQSNIIGLCILGVVTITTATLAFYAWKNTRHQANPNVDNDQLDALDILKQQDEKVNYEQRIAELSYDTLAQKRQLDLMIAQRDQAVAKNSSNDLIVEIYQLRNAGQALQGMCTLTLQQKKLSPDSLQNVLQQTDKFEYDVAQMLKNPNLPSANAASTFKLRQALKMKDAKQELEGSLKQVRTSAQSVRTQFKMKEESAARYDQKKQHADSREA